MKKLILITTLLITQACAHNKAPGGEGLCPDTILSKVDYDASESMNWGNHDMKIMVIGHAYDFTYTQASSSDNPAMQNELLQMIAAEAPDMVVFGGDSIVGTSGVDMDGVEHQWQKFYSQITSHISADIRQVSGNHDGWSQYCGLQQAMYDKFHEHNKVNYSVDVSAYGRHIGLHFVYNGDFHLTPERFAPIANTFQNFDENIVFGGESVNSPDILTTLNSANVSQFTYVSGDNQPVNGLNQLSNVDDYNVLTWCPSQSQGLDALVITIGQNGTNVQYLGNCGHS